MQRVTLEEAITFFDEQVPNQTSREEKIRWISELDERIYNEIIKRRLPYRAFVRTITESDVGNATDVFLTLFDYNNLLDIDGTEFTQEQIDTKVIFEPVTEDVGREFGTLTFNGYGDDTNGETVLLVPSMYKDIYRYWVEQKIDIINREMGAANNAMALFNAYYEDYYGLYNYNHRITERRRISIY